jgi:hypothetical protein
VASLMPGSGGGGSNAIRAGDAVGICGDCQVLELGAVTTRLQ